MAHPEPANPREEAAQAPSGKTEAAAFSYWGLIWWRYKRNRIGVVGGVALLLLYALVLPAELTAPYPLNERHTGFLDVPPQFIRFIKPDGRFSLRPFVYGLKQERDPETLRRLYVPNEEEIYPVGLFVPGERELDLPGTYLGPPPARRRKPGQALPPGHRYTGPRPPVPTPVTVAASP